MDLKRNLNILKINLKFKIKILPNQLVTDSNAGGIRQPQMGRYNETKKNGVQHATKVPVIIANVRQAFLSRRVSTVSFNCFLRRLFPDIRGFERRFANGFSFTKKNFLFKKKILCLKITLIIINKLCFDPIINCWIFVNWHFQFFVIRHCVYRTAFIFYL